jgi:tRNA A37 threonylcarbamoyladenosine synthetase subunit TsaC/SUA5/YrdC
LVLGVSGLPDAITSGTASVAVRVPDHGFLRQLCRRVGPVVSTSANLSGRPAPRTCAEALVAVGAAAALAIDGGPGRPLPSTVVDAREEEPRLLRAGAIAWEAVLRALRPRIQSKA